MALSSKLLGADEHVVRHMHTHVKALIWPAMALIVIAVFTGVGLALLPANQRNWSNWVVIGIAVVAFLIWVVYPLIRWWTTTYTITDRRIITRRGIITRTGHDLPLNRINDVSYERDLVDRVLGCGSLVLTTAAHDPVVLPDIPDVERVHVQMTELLFGDEAPEHEKRD